MENRRFVIRMREGQTVHNLFAEEKGNLTVEGIHTFKEDKNADAHQYPLNLEDDSAEKSHYEDPFYRKLGKLDKEKYRTFTIDADNEQAVQRILDKCKKNQEQIEEYYEDGKIYFHAPPNDPEFLKSQQKFYQKLGIEDCWDSVKGKGIVVSVIDTGVNANHPDLKQNLLNSTGVLDERNHGTPVAGIIAAVGNNGQGVIGIAPEALVQMHKVALAGNEAFMTAAIKAMEEAKDSKARIINCSFGVSSNWRNSDAEKAFQKEINELSSKLLFVFSSGNGTDNDLAKIDIKDTFLNELNRVLKVGALEDNDSVASYSNFGEDVIHAYGKMMSTSNNGGYGFFTHTSAAAPQVAGICALLMSHNPLVSPHKVIEIIQKSATITSGGVKRVNAFEALKLMKQEFGFVV